MNGETLTLNSNSLTVTGDLTITGSGVLDASTGTPTITVGGDWDSSAGTFSPGTGSTVRFNGTGGTSRLTSGGSPFNDLTIDDSGGSLTVQLQDDTEVTGNLAVTSGTLDYNSQAVTLSGGGNSYTIGTNGIVTGSGGTTNISGTITFTDGSTSGNQNIGDLNVN